ncbi:hypothetical protein Tco_0704754 [Tanacetum coccineum]|uniref:Reverse transcriptase domain-containing protein n=1 Tax=Tanacetum coccineum TaxID=301880 RepID=A0ABQ4Y4M3_9ASTR
MRTRNSNFPNNSPVTIPRRQNRRRAPNVVEPELRTIVEVAPMAERTMEELLRAPTEGYGEAIVIPEINADHFEIKTNLLQLVQASPFHGFERENPHTHINNFKRITSTLKFKDVPNDVIKLMMFLYSLEGAARVWMNTTSRESVSKTDERIDKLADQISTLVEIISKKVVTSATVKAIEESCVTCGSAHAWYNCPNTDNNQSSVCVATDNGTSQSKYNFQSSSTSSATKVLKQDLIIPSFLDSCFISSTVSEDKRAMLCLDFQICAQDKNFSSICAYTTMMLPRVCNHHGGKCVHPGLS